MAELSRFAQDGDHEKMAFFAHKLKSASGAIGFNLLTKPSRTSKRSPSPWGRSTPSTPEGTANHCIACMVDIETIMKGL